MGSGGQGGDGGEGGQGGRHKREGKWTYAPGCHPLSLDNPTTTPSAPMSPPPKLLVSQKEILSKPNLHPSSLNRAPSVVGNQQELPLSSFPPSCLVLLMLFFHGTVAKPGASLELW